MRTMVYKFDGIVIWMPEDSEEPYDNGFFADPSVAADYLRLARGQDLTGPSPAHREAAQPTEEDREAFAKHLRTIGMTELATKILALRD